MIAILAVLFIVLPLLEIALLIQVADAIGGWWTVLMLVAVSIVGAVLAKREGALAWKRFRLAMRERRVPSNEIIDGFLILFAAALLLTPGFISDVLGIALLVPVTRASMRRLMFAGGKFALFKRFPVASTAVTSVRSVRTGKSSEKEV